MKNTTTIKVIFSVLVATTVISTASEASWLIYHKPSYEGKVIDAETKLPIEGAVVVVIYYKNTIGIPERYSSIINVRETLTGADGMFRIPSYTTLIQPLSWEDSSTFIVFKLGYAPIDKLNLEEVLSKDTAKPAVELPWLYNKYSKFIVASRLLGLPKVNTREERRHASTIGVSGYSKKDLPLLHKALSEDDRTIGVK